MKKMIRLVAGAVLFGVLSGAVFQGVNYVSGGRSQVTLSQDQQASSQDQMASSQDQQALLQDQQTVDSGNSGADVDSGITRIGADNTDRGSGVSGVAEYVLPSIVAIDVKVVSRQQDFFGRTFESEGMGSGSGIIMKEDSDYIYIVTNNHVVEESVQVSTTFYDETKADATVIGTDANTDLAVVRVAKRDLKDETRSGIRVAQTADSTKLKVGEQAIAIGNALGYGTSVTVGYVSARDREISTSQEEDGRRAGAGSEDTDQTMKLIQTDAAINPGNSGGALVNASGQVIGINSSKFASEEVEGMGFAIPISTALPIVERLISGGGSDGAHA